MGRDSNIRTGTRGQDWTTAATGLLFGLLILAVPLLVAVFSTVLIMVSLPLLPIAMPISTCVVSGLVLYAWARHRRYLLRGW